MGATSVQGHDSLRSIGSSSHGWKDAVLEKQILLFVFFFFFDIDSGFLETFVLCWVHGGSYDVRVVNV